jgi:hypothetical protein
LTLTREWKGKKCKFEVTAFFYNFNLIKFIPILLPKVIPQNVKDVKQQYLRYKTQNDRKTQKIGKIPAKQYQNEHNFLSMLQIRTRIWIVGPGSAIGMRFRIQQERRNSLLKMLYVGRRASSGALKFFMEV